MVILVGASTLITAGAVALLRLALKGRPGLAVLVLVVTMCLGPMLLLPIGYGLDVATAPLIVFGFLPVVVLIVYFLAYYSRRRTGGTTKG